MKRVVVVACLALLSFGFSHRQAQPYRVAFDLTSRDSLDQKAVLRWIKETSTASPDVQIEVVMYGKGFELVMPERSPVIADVQDAMKNPNVQTVFGLPFTRGPLEAGTLALPIPSFSVAQPQQGIDD